MKVELLDSKVFGRVRSSHGALLWTLKKPKDNIKVEPGESGAEGSKHEEVVVDDTPTYTLADGVYTCSQCQEQRPKKFQIERHLLGHLFASSYKYRCKNCTFKTQSKSKLARHTWCVPVKCDQCDFKTRSKTSLEQHTKSHVSQGKATIVQNLG